MQNRESARFIRWQNFVNVGLTEGQVTWLYYFSVRCRNIMWAGQLSRYSDWLRAWRSGNRIPVEARFSAPVQTGPRAHPASCTMGNGPFLGVESRRSVTLTSNPLLVPRSEKQSRVVPLLSLRAFVACETGKPYLQEHYQIMFLAIY
jgi:hypothetical protein